MRELNREGMAFYEAEGSGTYRGISVQRSLGNAVAFLFNSDIPREIAYAIWLFLSPAGYFIKGFPSFSRVPELCKGGLFLFCCSLKTQIFKIWALIFHFPQTRERLY